MWKAIRVGALLGTSILLLCSALGLAMQTRGVQMDAVTTEHRFTSLEDKVDNLIRDITEIKLTRWLELLGISGLIGERGIQIISRKM